MHIVQIVDFGCPDGKFPCLPLLKIWEGYVALFKFYDALYCNMALTSVYGLAKGYAVLAWTFIQELQA